MVLQVVDNVFETMDSALMEKLEANADLEADLLQSRKTLLEQLISYTSSLKTDQSLWKLLDTHLARTLGSLPHDVSLAGRSEGRQS